MAEKQTNKERLKDITDSIHVLPPFALAVLVFIIIHMIAQPEGKAQCAKSKFTELTILRFDLQAQFAPPSDKVL